MKFTKNERYVLKALMDNARQTDTDIGRKLNITVQAVRKIRKKLEDSKVIMGYSASVNYAAAGIKVFAIALLNVTPAAWEKFPGRKVEDILMHANVMKFYRIPRDNISHIVIYGFRDLSEQNHFFKHLQEEHSKYINIMKVYTIPNEGIGKKSSHSLIRRLLDEQGSERLPVPNKFQ